VLDGTYLNKSKMTTCFCGSLVGRAIAMTVKNPGKLCWLAGVWNFVNLCLVPSGCPIGELSRNNRYSDENNYANDDYVKKSDYSRIQATGRNFKREL